MSEPIQSIATGTYMIGETTQTELQAGPGISITQPSEGTVRIANDETVLWSADYSNNTTSATLSEGLDHFEFVDIVWCHQNKSLIVNRYPTESKQFLCYLGRENEISWGTVSQFFVFGAVWAKDQWTSNTTLTKRICQYHGFGSTGATSANELVPVKIVGINRISGGNNE